MTMSGGRIDLEAILWEGDDVLRSRMDANEYKDDQEIRFSIEANELLECYQWDEEN